jgi:hypothetical protein
MGPRAAPNPAPPEAAPPAEEKKVEPAVEIAKSASDEPVRIRPWATPEHARRGVTKPNPRDLRSYSVIVGEWGKNLGKAWRAGLAKTDPSLVPIAKKALEALEDKSEAALAALGVDEVAAAAHLCSPDSHEAAIGDEFMNVIVSKHGAAFALDVLARADTMATEAEHDQSWKLKAVSLRPGADGLAVGQNAYVHGGLSLLREVIAHAPDDEYAKLRAKAEGMLATTSARIGIALAYLFPTERWGNAKARALLDTIGKDDMPPYAWPLLASVTDPALAMELLKKAMAVPYSTVPDHYAHALVDAFGEGAVPLLAKLLDRAREAYHKEQYGPALTRIESVAAAEEMARALEDKTLRPMALDMFERAPKIAARALANVAASRSKDANGAVALLRAWVTSKRKLIDLVRPSLDAKARAVVDAMIAEASIVDATTFELPADLRAMPVLKKAKTMPAFWKPAELPRPLLAGRQKQIPLAAVEVLGILLALSDFTTPHPSLATVKKALDPASLTEFAWGLYSAWMAEGGTSKENWAFAALGHLGGDEAARRITPRIREWPGEGGHARATTGLDVLATIGSDVALMNLNGIAEKVKFKGLQERARQKIQQIAAARGLTREELADRLVPDLGLDERGTMVLDLGGRSFRVGFDHELRPLVLDEGGKRVSDLPKANKSDDAEKAAAAHAAWKALKQDAKTLAKAQIDRLERAMCSRRTWNLATFRAVLADHPLMRHLARRLVWGTYEDGKLARTFRVDESGGFADAGDAALALADNAIIGIPHVLESADLGTTWGPIFADYELVQPFAQLGRPTFAPTAEEKKTNVLDRVKGKKAKLGRVLELSTNAWRLGAPQDAGWIWDMSKQLPGPYEVDLGLASGVLAGSRAESPPEQELGSVVLSGNGASAKKKPTWADVDPIGFSELVYDLVQLVE